MPSKLLVALLSALLAAVLAAGGPAHAVVSVAGPGATIAGYATQLVVAPVGGPLQFANGDFDPHNFVAQGVFGAGNKSWCNQFPAGRCPLFWSAAIGLGEVTPVLGLEQATSGEMYPFYCSIHPTMVGTLVTI